MSIQSMTQNIILTVHEKLYLILLHELNQRTKDASCVTKYPFVLEKQTNLTLRTYLYRKIYIIWEPGIYEIFKY